MFRASGFGVLGFTASGLDVAGQNMLPCFGIRAEG